MMATRSRRIGLALCFLVLGTFLFEPALGTAVAPVMSDSKLSQAKSEDLPLPMDEVKDIALEALRPFAEPGASLAGARRDPKALIGNGLAIGAATALVLTALFVFVKCIQYLMSMSEASSSGGPRVRRLSDKNPCGTSEDETGEGSGTQDETGEEEGGPRDETDEEDETQNGTGEGGSAGRRAATWLGAFVNRPRQLVRQAWHGTVRTLSNLTGMPEQQVEAIIVSSAVSLAVSALYQYATGSAGAPGGVPDDGRSPGGRPDDDPNYAKGSRIPGESPQSPTVQGGWSPVRGGQ